MEQNKATSISETEGKDRGHKKNVLTAAKGGGINFVGRFAENGISLIFVIAMARLLGAEQYGTYKLMVIITSIASAICLLGLNGGMYRYIAIANKEGNENKIWGIIQIGIGIPLVISLLVTLLFLFLAEPISLHIFKEPSLIPILRIGCLSIPFLVLAYCFGAMALGFKNVKYDVIARAIGFNTIKLVLSLLAIAAGFTVIGISIVYVVAAFSSFVIFLFFVPRLFNFKRSFKSAERNTKELMKFSLPLFVSLLLNQFSRRFENLVLGAFSIVSNVGIYATILTISNIGNMGFTALRNISNPIFSELHSENKIDELRRFYQTVTKWSLSFNIPFFLTIFLFNESLLSLFGADFAVGATGMIILAAGTLFNASTGVCGSLINMSGHSKVSMVNSAIYLATTLILDFSLIPSYGLIGAAIAGSATIMIVNTLRLIEVYFLVNKILPFNWSFYKPLLSGLIAFGVTYLLKPLVLTNHIFMQFVVLNILMWGLFIGILYLLKLSDEDRIILDALRKRKKNKKIKK